jgi:hypothetical protein
MQLQSTGFNELIQKMPTVDKVHVDYAGCFNADGELVGDGAFTSCRVYQRSGYECKIDLTLIEDIEYFLQDILELQLPEWWVSSGHGSFTLDFTNRVLIHSHSHFVEITDERQYEICQE